MRILSMTFPDWSVLLDSYQQSLGYNPLTGTAHERDPHVFMGALDFDKSITQALHDSQIILNHYSLSMIGELDEATLLEMTSVTDLHIHHHEAERRHYYLTLASGTIRKWRDSCFSMCQDGRTNGCRLLGNEIVQSLERAGFRDCFKLYKKKPSNRKGFTLE